MALVERFRTGHDRGSSHGVLRVTRSAYIGADYVRLMQISPTRRSGRASSSSASPGAMPGRQRRGPSGATSTLHAEHLVVTAGTWARELIPTLRARLSVAHQTVGYFELEGLPENYRHLTCGVDDDPATKLPTTLATKIPERGRVNPLLGRVS